MEELTTQTPKTNIIEQATGILAEARFSELDKPHKKIPIMELSALGSEVSSLVPSMRTMTQTSTIDTTGLYRLVNKGAEDTLKLAKDGNYWGSFKTADGGSKFLKLTEADPLSVTSELAMPIDPATMMMAAALYSIEKQLKTIEAQGQEIISFLEIEKESEIEANIETLLDMISKFKHNWNNEHFVSNNHKLALDIKHNARKHMISYQKKVKDILEKKQLVVIQNQVNSTLKKLLKMFKYYRLSLYTYSMASFAEIILSGNYNEENVCAIKREIERLSLEYRAAFTECSGYLEKMTGVALDKNLLKGAGNVVMAAGDMVGKIPLVKKAPADKLLKKGGEKLAENAKDFEEGTLREFAGISDPGTRTFTERMADIVTVYNHTESICFDGENVYLIEES